VLTAMLKDFRNLTTGAVIPPVMVSSGDPEPLLAPEPVPRIFQ